MSSLQLTNIFLFRYGIININWITIWARAAVPDSTRDPLNELTKSAWRIPMWMGNSVKWASTDWEKYGNWIHWPQKIFTHTKKASQLHTQNSRDIVGIADKTIGIIIIIIILTSIQSVVHMRRTLIAQHSMQIDAEEAAQCWWLWWGCAGKLGNFRYLQISSSVEKYFSTWLVNSHPHNVERFFGEEQFSPTAQWLCVMCGTIELLPGSVETWIFHFDILFTRSPNWMSLSVDESLELKSFFAE